jgi:hypothetical protein
MTTLLRDFPDAAERIDARATAKASVRSARAD